MIPVEVEQASVALVVFRPGLLKYESVLSGSGASHAPSLLCELEYYSSAWLLLVMVYIKSQHSPWSARLAFLFCFALGKASRITWVEAPSGIPL